MLGLAYALYFLGGDGPPDCFLIDRDSQASSVGADRHDLAGMLAVILTKPAVTAVWEGWKPSSETILNLPSFF